MSSIKRKSIYLDYAATTPVDPAVVEEYRRVQEYHFGNPHSRHAFGQAALVELDRARDVIAASVNAEPLSVLFTSGATEANNLVIRGVCDGLARGKKNQFLCSAIEHPSVIEPAQWVKRLGVGVEMLGVNRQGLLRLDELEAKVTDDTRLISVMAVNNEIGSIQPVSEIGAWIAQKNADRSGREIDPILFHVDATQALLTLPVDLSQWGADFCSLSSHKVYGPKGVGALIARSLQPLVPFMHGGPQERGRRPGTVNVPGIVAFAKAVQINEAEKSSEAKRLRSMRDETLDVLRSTFPDLQWVGPVGEQRVPNNLNFYFPGLDSGTLALTLDLEGFAVSTGSACAAGAEIASHVLNALALPFSPRSSLRITFGRQTQAEDLKQFVAALQRVVTHQRSLHRSTSSERS